LSPDEAPAGPCATGASGVYLCASNPPILGQHSRPRGLLLFLSRYNRASEGQARCFYEHLTVPIRRISRFRQGAEVALKVPMQIRRQEFWFALLQTLIS